EPGWWAGGPTAHRRRRQTMTQLGVHQLRHQQLSEQFWKYSALADQHQVIERTGIGDNEPHAASEAGLFEVLSVTFQIVEGVRLKHVMRLQEPVERFAGGEAQQSPQFRLG